MTIFQRFFLMVAVVSLSFSSISFADCGWVLWTKTISGEVVGDKTTKWEYIDTYKKREHCKTERENIWDINNKSYNAPNKLPSVEFVTGTRGKMVWVLFKNGHMTSYTFYCVPDTVDPRPKR